MAVLTVLAVTVALGVLTAGQSTPGCSSANGQCTYNINLDHQGQCNHSNRDTRASNDNSNSHPTSTSCSCQDVENAKYNVNSIQSHIRDLQGSFRHLASTLNTTRDQLGLGDADIAALQGANKNLTAVIQHSDQLLNKSQVELANIVTQTSTELGRLKQELATTNHDLTVCKTNLHITDTLPTQPSAVDGHYRTWYCPFTASNICNFTSESISHHGQRWKLGTGRVNTQSGPLEDHTFGAPHGYYMYIDPYDNPPYGGSSTSITTARRTARIASPVFQPADHYCLRFWYTMYGKDVDHLNVYAKVGSGLGYPVFKASGQVDQYWHMAEVSLDSEYTATPFQMVLEGTSTSYYIYDHRFSSSTKKTERGLGYIAIDDVFVYNTSCKAIPSCPADGRKVVDGNETSCYTFHVTPTSWYDAIKVCKNEAPNGQLVSVTSAKEQLYLVNTIKSDAGLVTAGSNGWYTSGNDERDEGRFVWTDTGYPYAVNYTNWHMGQPNNVGNSQQCLLLQYSDDDYEWGDVNCYDKHPFICEIKL